MTSLAACPSSVIGGLLLILAGTITPATAQVSPSVADSGGTIDRTSGRVVVLDPVWAAGRPGRTSSSPRRVYSVHRTALAASRPSHHLHPRDRWRAFRSEVASTRFVVRSTITTVAAHLSGEPSGWRNDALGFGARLASNKGAILLQLGAEHASAAVVGTDIRYHPRNDGRVGRRISHAALRAVTMTDAQGRRWPNVLLASTAFGTALAQQQWEQNERNLGDALLTTLTTIGLEMAGNLAVEFLP